MKFLKNWNFNEMSYIYPEKTLNYVYKESISVTSGSSLKAFSNYSINDFWQPPQKWKEFMFTHYVGTDLAT